MPRKNLFNVISTGLYKDEVKKSEVEVLFHHSFTYKFTYMVLRKPRAATLGTMSNVPAETGSDYLTNKSGKFYGFS
jgi:hypothetical protein